MRWTDSELGDEIRRLDPADNHESWSPVDEASAFARFHREASMQNVASRPTRRWARSRRAALMAATAAVVSAVIVLATTTFGHAPEASAHGPHPLPFTPIDKSVTGVVAEAQNRLVSHHTGQPQLLRRAETSGWYAQINGNAIESGLTAILPEDRLVQWESDLSGSIVVTAGVPYTTDGTPIPDGAAPPGEVLWSMEFAAGEFTPAEPSPPPTDPTLLREVIERQISGVELPGAADFISGFSELLGSWTLTDAHHAAFLEILREDAGAFVAGLTTDRANRPAIGIRATSHQKPWIDMIVLISTETGRVIGTEQIYTGLKNELPIPNGTVIAYTLWETP